MRKYVLNAVLFQPSNVRMSLVSDDHRNTVVVLVGRISRDERQHTKVIAHPLTDEIWLKVITAGHYLVKSAIEPIGIVHQGEKHCHEAPEELGVLFEGGYDRGRRCNPHSIEVLE